MPDTPRAYEVLLLMAVPRTPEACESVALVVPCTAKEPMPSASAINAFVPPVPTLKLA